MLANQVLEKNGKPTSDCGKVCKPCEEKD
jgi:hypothetical protein